MLWNSQAFLDFFDQHLTRFWKVCRQARNQVSNKGGHFDVHVIDSCFSVHSWISLNMASYDTEVPVLDTYQSVVSAYSDFLTVAIHTILYERNIYPQTSFIKARKYNYPVRQNRHPRLCKWIMDAVASVEVEMLKV